MLKFGGYAIPSQHQAQPCHVSPEQGMGLCWRAYHTALVWNCRSGGWRTCSQTWTSTEFFHLTAALSCFYLAGLIVWLGFGLSFLRLETCPKSNPQTSLKWLKLSRKSQTGRWPSWTYPCMSAQLCLTLCDPTDYSLPGSSVHEISQARILEWMAMSSSRGSSQPRDWTHVSCISCIGRLILYYWAKRETPSWTQTWPLKIEKEKSCGMQLK